MDPNGVTVLLTLTSTYTLGGAPATAPAAFTIPVRTLVAATTTSLAASSLAAMSRSSSASSGPSSGVSSSVSTTSQTGFSKTSSPVQIDGLLAPSEPNSLVKLGLAIGIPLAVVVVFAAVAVGWHFYRRSRTRKMVAYDGDFFSVEKPPTRPNDIEKGPDSISRQWIATRSSDDSLDVNYRPGPVAAKYNPSSFLHRLSRMVFPEDMPQEGTKQRWASPMSLKKFHLYKSPKDAVSGDRPEKRKPLPKLPPIISTFRSNSLENMENAVERAPETRVASKAYTRRLGDEISLAVGDRVRILKDHTDGWSLVRDNSGREGMVPRFCLAPAAREPPI